MTRHRRAPDLPAIVDDAAPVSPAHRPTWWTVSNVRWIAFAAIWLALGLALLAVLINYRQAQTAQEVATATNRRLTALEQYVDGKGAERDRENAALNQRITQAICDLLDQLPAGGLLDKPRTKYGCGPGLAPQATATQTASAAAPDRTRPRPDPSASPSTTPTATGAQTQTQPPAQPTAGPATAPPANGSPTPLVCGLVPQLCPTP